MKQISQYLEKFGKSEKILKPLENLVYSDINLDRPDNVLKETLQTLPPKNMDG